MATYYVVGSGGSDSANGLTEATGFATLAKWISVSANNDFVWLKGDGQIYAETCVITKTGVTIMGYGATRPILWGFATKTGFANGGSNQWSVAQTVDPLNVYFFATTGTYFGQSGTITKGAEVASKAAVVSAGQWFWDDPTDTLWIFSTSDPATAFGAVRVNSLTNGFKATTQINVTLENVAAWGQWGAASEFITGSNGFIARGCHFAFFSEDGAGGTDCTGTLIEYCLIEYGGQIFGVISSAGDGISWHGTSTFTIRKNTVRNMSKSAFNSIQVANGTIEANLVYDCFLNIVCFQDAGSQQVVLSNLVITGAANPGALTFDDGTVQVIGNTFYGTGTTAVYGGIAVLDPTSTGTIYAYNNVITNFDYGYYNDSALTTWVEGNNSLGGNGDPSGSGLGAYPLGTSIAINASDITTAPLLVNPTGTEAGNYRLQPGSPAKNTGILLNPAIGPPFMQPPTFDFTGRTIGSTPDMGAFAFTQGGSRSGAGSGGIGLLFDDDE